MCSPIECRRFLALLSRVVCVESTYKPPIMTEECGGRKVLGVLDTVRRVELVLTST